MLTKEIYKNCKGIDKEQLENLYESLYPTNSTGIIGDGEGRSYLGFLIGTSELRKLLKKIRIFGSNDSYFPGDNLVDAFKRLKEICEKRIYLVVSGSGRSYVPHENLKTLSSYLKENDDNVQLNLITSSPNSQMGEIIKEHEGNILELEGRKLKTANGKEYLKEGVLEDKFELEATTVLSIISRAINNNIPPEDFYGFYENNLKTLTELEEKINEIKKTDEYEEFLKALENPYKSLFSCGQGVSELVIKMNNIRVGHVRPLTIYISKIKNNFSADKNFVIGESNCPNMDKNSILLCVSKSGKTPRIQKYLVEAKSVGAESFIITGNQNYKNIGNEGILFLNPENFYVNTSIVLSEMLTDLGRNLCDKGVEINEEILRALHIKDKI